MHDLRAVRDAVDALSDGMSRRGKLDTLAPLLERAESLGQQRRLYIQAVEERKAARNATSQEVAKRKRAGCTKSSSTPASSGAAPAARCVSG